MPPFAAAASVRTSEPMPVCECPYMTLLRYVARRRQVFSLTSAASRLRISLLGAHAPLVHPRKEGITVILDATLPLSSWRSAGQRAARAALSLPGPSPGVSTCRDSSRRVVADPQWPRAAIEGHSRTLVHVSGSGTNNEAIVPTAQPSAGALVRWACRSDNRTRVGRVTLQRMDNVGIVV